MDQAEKLVAFREREFKGSRYRCLLATTGPKDGVVKFLSSLLPISATITEHSRYRPAGFARPDEAKLGESPLFLNGEQREALMAWWLAVRRRANTPTWDLVSTCKVDGLDGLVLIEAKAHEGELNANDCCGAKNKSNRDQIAAAIKGANMALGPGWGLTSESHYQLANRFAWASKIASLGVPVVLVYLGFLNANEMSKPFVDSESWERSVVNYSRNVIPTGIWGSESLRINGTPLLPLIRSADVKVQIASYPQSE